MSYLNYIWSTTKEINVNSCSNAQIIAWMTKFSNKTKLTLIITCSNYY